MNFNMRLSALAFIGLLGCSQHSTYARRLGERGLQEEEACPRIGKNTNFNQESLAAYVSGEWYVHEQAVTTYLPEGRNYCVTASYKQIPRTFWGYTIEVNNQAKNANGETFGGILAAAQTNPQEDPSKLEVAPGFLPRFLAGLYWILEFQQEEEDGEEWALIVGGQPDVRTENGCKTKNRFITSSGGLWIFTRSSERNDDLIEKIKTIAVDKYELDTTVLNFVNQTASFCGY
mmetsp:Transcript_3469/g.9874  ORF Transcript_3469/g.9874 Transcript_3469/m.9874 type:complete len:232 (-) Transcript_3469:74-769(-)